MTMHNQDQPMPVTRLAWETDAAYAARVALVRGVEREVGEPVRPHPAMFHTAAGYWAAYDKWGVAMIAASFGISATRLVPPTDPLTAWHARAEAKRQHPVATRAAGYYWVRSTDPQYPRIFIAEWSDDRWSYCGVSGTDSDGLEVLSAPIECAVESQDAPFPVRRCGVMGLGDVAGLG